MHQNSHITVTLLTSTPKNVCGNNEIQNEAKYCWKMNAKLETIEKKILKIVDQNEIDLSALFDRPSYIQQNKTHFYNTKQPIERENMQATIAATKKNRHGFHYIGQKNSNSTTVRRSNCCAIIGFRYRETNRKKCKANSFISYVYMKMTDFWVMWIYCCCCFVSLAYVLCSVHSFWFTVQSYLLAQQFCGCRYSDGPHWDKKESAWQNQWTFAWHNINQLWVTTNQFWVTNAGLKQ